MPTNIPIKNTNQRNHLKVVTETLVEVPVDEKSKDKTPKKIWSTPVVTYLKPGESVDIWVAETRRFNVQEMPT